MTAMKMRELSLVAASAVVVLVVLAAFALGVVVGDRTGQAEEPGVETETTIESIAIGEETATETTTVSKESGDCGPEAEGPIVCLEGVSVADGEVTFELVYVGFTLSLESGMHAHLYPGSQSPEEVGVGGAGIWAVVDQTTFKLPMSDQVVEKSFDSGLACVATAGAVHELVHESVSCVEIVE